MSTFINDMILFSRVFIFVSTHNSIRFNAILNKKYVFVQCVVPFIYIYQYFTQNY